MNALVFVLWSIVGWCGTPPKPRPKPEPRYIIAGIFGGIVGGVAAYYALGLEGALSSMDFVATAIGAFAGGRVLSDITFLLTHNK